MYCFHWLQKALKEQQIDIQEVHKDVLGTDKEKQVPPKTSWPWSFRFCGWICSSSFTNKLAITHGSSQINQFDLISKYECSSEPITKL